MELARQHERERSEFSEKHRQKAGYYYGHQELEHPRQILNNDQFVYFTPIDARQMLTDAPPSLGYARSYGNNDSSELLYKIFRGDTKLVRSMLEANYFSHTEAHEWNILWSSGSCKAYLYEGLNEYQKINHFPSSQEITRKDKLAINVAKMQHRYGKQAFDFLPDTYVIPDEFGDFYSHFQRQQREDPKKNLWIVKPANLSRGRGIYIVDDIAEVNVDELSIISRYIGNPLLINGHKFDLRIYVCVTSVDPLRIYVFKEGLARFATQEYTSNTAKGNKFIHLTNYSINKKSQNYVQNEDLENDDYGFKWSLSAFCKHLEQIDIDMDLFWSRIFDIIIKSFLAAESQIFTASKKTCIHRTNCYEVYGFDIMIDSDFKPWLIEINLSPSLACDSNLDMKIKSQLLADTFNLIGVRQFDRKAESANKAKNRMKSYQNRGKSMQANRMNGMFNPLRDLQNLNNQLGGAFNSFMARSIGGNRSGSQDSVELNFTQAPNINVIRDIEKLDRDGEWAQEIDMLKKLSTVKNKEIMRETLLEFQRKGNYVCIYPARGSEVYDQYFQQVRPLNRYLNRVLFQSDVLESLQAPSSKNFDEQTPTKTTAGGKNPLQGEDSSTKLKRSQDGVNFKNIKDQLQDIQNVAKHAERTMAQMISKSNSNLSLSQQKKGSNSSKMLQTMLSSQDDGHQLSQKSSKISFFRNNPSLGKQASETSFKKKTLTTIDAQQTQQQEVTNTYTIEGIESHQAATSPKASAGPVQKIVISGDDILIEYCERLKHALRQIPDTRLRPAQQAQLIRFITHYVWQMPDKQEVIGKRHQVPTATRPEIKAVSFWSRIQNRISEMKERRKRLVKMTSKTKGNPKKFAAEFSSIILQKQTILNKFDSNKLESVLKESTKSTALELVLTLLPKSLPHGILVDLEASFGLTVDPQSPSYTQKKTGQLDANGNTIPLTETSLVIGDSDEDAHSSPVAAYSGSKNNEDSINRSHPSDKLVRASTNGFTSSSDFQNNSKQSQSSKGMKQTNGGKQMGSGGIVLLQDMMLDRSAVELVGRNTKASKMPNGGSSAITTNERSHRQEGIAKKSSQSELYEQNILNAIRTNNFFMNSNAPNSSKMGATGYNKSNSLTTSLPQQKNLAKNSLNSQQSQQLLGTQQKLTEPSMVHSTKLPPSARTAQQQHLLKSNRLPPTRSTTNSYTMQNQMQQPKTQQKRYVLSSAKINPTGSNSRSNFLQHSANLGVTSGNYRNSYNQFSEVSIPTSLKSAINDFHKQGAKNLGSSQAVSNRQGGWQQNSERGFSQARDGNLEQRRTLTKISGQRSLTMFGHGGKQRAPQPGNQASGQFSLGGKSLGVKNAKDPRASGLSAGRNPGLTTMSREFTSNGSSKMMGASNKMQSRIKSAVIANRQGQNATNQTSDY